MTLAVQAFRDAAALAARDPLRFAAWSAWQREFLADASANRLIRAANQIGKTTVLVADMVHEIRGTNPYRPRRFSGPVNLILLSESLEQMAAPGAILAKLWEILPKDEIDPRIYFVPGEGIRGGKIPAIRFIAGPGAGSVISLRTYRQDPKTLAGATVHHVYCDEPMPARTYGELQPRLLRHNGTFTLSFTPTLSMPDQGWARELIDAGVFREHHARMIPANAWPEGYARPFLSQERIDEAIKAWPAIEVPMRVDAAWEPVIADRWLTGFSDAAARPFTWRDVPSDAQLIVGIDHGLVIGKQWAVLVAIADGDTDRPRYWFVAEAGGAEVSSPDQDAAKILEMLRGVGCEYASVDDWVGDRDTGDGRQLKSKSNALLRVQLWYQSGITSGSPAAKLIATPIKGAGSVHYGLGLINAAFADGRAVIHPRCQALIKAIQSFRGDSRDVHKDVLDAARYAIERGTRKRIDLSIRGSYGGRARR